MLCTVHIHDLNVYLEEERLPGRLGPRSKTRVETARGGGWGVGASPAPQFCFKNCTRTCVCAKLFTGPRAPGPSPQAVVFSLPHSCGLRLNLLTAEKVSASFRGPLRECPALGTPACLQPPGRSGPSLPRGPLWREVAPVRVSLAFFCRGTQFLSGFFLRRFSFWTQSKLVFPHSCNCRALRRGGSFQWDQPCTQVQMLLDVTSLYISIYIIY